ncbi:uncharacterized protein LOC133900769 [Phragmites australis]|uniref:uncharacterized protein LOC133900769 n=1 Tax=Phragmites australis TaxID=29695 RepID=UPI002D76BDA1|nr:uncharacterized protein LOC133900769 [Phragmites australis]
METREITISSIEDLESAIRDLGPRARVFVRFVDAGDLFEAATIYHRLLIHFSSSQGHWKIDQAVMERLRRAAEHYEQLGLLEITLDLMDLDLKDDILMKAARFGGVRATANDVVTTSHPSSTLAILGNITIEAQRIARVARALAFGGIDVEVPVLTEEDIVWLTADGIGASKGMDAVEIGHGEGEGVGVAGALRTGGGNNWILTKKEHTEAFLRGRIDKLRNVIAAAKSGPFL